MLLAAGAVAAPASIFAGGDLATAGFFSLTALAAFFMNHAERGMHPTTERGNIDRDGEHSTDESREYRPHSTTTITKEN